MIYLDHSFRVSEKLDIFPRLQGSNVRLLTLSPVLHARLYTTRDTRFLILLIYLKQGQENISFIEWL